MIRYTTPTHTLIVGGVDLTDCDVYVSYRQVKGSSKNANSADIDDPTVAYDGTDTVITVPLTQLQTGGFTPGRAQVQVNWITSSGIRRATEIATINVTDNLLQEVIEYGA